MDILNYVITSRKYTDMTSRQTVPGPVGTER